MADDSRKPSEEDDDHFCWNPGDVTIIPPDDLEDDDEDEEDDENELKPEA